MSISYDVLVEGNSLSFKGGFFGFSSIILIKSAAHGLLLFDTGHHSTRLLLINALQERGLSPTDINYVFLSHLHFDHVNNIDLFTQATIYLSAEEWEYAQNPNNSDPFCSPAINLYLQQQKLIFLENSTGEIFPNLFYRHTPGHTPGSYVLHFVNQQNKRVVLAGDACKTYKELASLEVVSEFDPEKRAQQSLIWMNNYADVVIPGHFPPLFRTENGWLWHENTHLELIVR